MLKITIEGQCGTGKTAAAKAIFAMFKSCGRAAEVDDMDFDGSDEIDFLKTLPKLKYIDVLIETKQESRKAL
jgi:hypothetical protein